MYKSKEIRWFSNHEEKQITNWFDSKGMSFEKVNSRTDFYLPLKRKNDIGIKLREGNIEVKHRIPKPELHNLSKHAVGYIEDWIKWSFAAADNDRLSNLIIHEKAHDWFEVYKERMGVKLTHDLNGNTILVKIGQRVDYACQIEYTRLMIGEIEYFTFGMEWFGEVHIQPDKSLISAILGNTQLPLNESKGYAQFLAELTKVK